MSCNPASLSEVEQETAHGEVSKANKMKQEVMSARARYDLLLPPEELPCAEAEGDGAGSEEEEFGPRAGLLACPCEWDATRSAGDSQGISQDDDC